MSNQKENQEHFFSKVLLFRGSDFYLSELEKSIKAAKKQIIINVYLFKNDEAGKRVVEALTKASERGVEVFISLDAVGSMYFSKEMISLIKKSGVKLTFFNPLWSFNLPRLQRRLHQKVFVFDNKFAYIGGVNIGNEYFAKDDKKRWLDYVLFLEGEIVSQISQVISYYHNEKIKSLRSEAISGHIKGTILLQDFWRGKRDLSREYRERIRRAKKSIVLMNAYFFPGRTFLRDLKKAVKRGVEVKLILGKVSDVKAVRWLTNCLYEDLVNSGIQIYEWEKSILHAKLALIDSNWATVGSFNLDYISRFSNIEINMASQSPEVVDLVENELNKVFESSISFVDIKEWKRRYYFFYRLRDSLILLFFKLFTFFFFSFSGKKKGT